MFLNLRVLRLLRLPSYTMDWYADRVERVRRHEVAGWAAAEIACMSFSISALLLIPALCVLRAYGHSAPIWLQEYVLPIFLAGAVGYLTNMIAVTMLFRPFGPEDTHPVGAIPGWSQGLIPRNKHELAEHAGRQVADKLLTPETIADEIRVLVEKALEDAELQDKLRYGLGPAIREKLPELAADHVPELMKQLRGMLSTGLAHENVDAFFDKVLDPWLRHGENKKIIAAEMANFMKCRIPRIMKWLKEMAERYKDLGRWKRLSVWFAEKTKALDWDEIQQVIHDRIDDRDGRKELLDAASDFVAGLREQITTSEASSSLRQLQDRSLDLAAEIVEKHLRSEIPGLGHRIADDPKFWQWLSQRALPALRPHIIGWLRGDAANVIRASFDVAGRVKDEVANMDVRKVHNMINEVSARHLGAIQVLGFVLGLIAGGCLVVI